MTLVKLVVEKELDEIFRRYPPEREYSVMQRNPDSYGDNRIQIRTSDSLLIGPENTGEYAPGDTAWTIYSKIGRETEVFENISLPDAIVLAEATSNASSQQGMKKHNV